MSSANKRNAHSDRREAARQRAAQLREETARRERRSRRITLISVISGVTVLAILIAVIITSGSRVSIEGVEDQPANITSGAFREGDVDNPKAVELIVFFDYKCTHCATFEQTNGADLVALTKEPGVVVSQYPVAFLDPFSRRAASASFCVADGAPEVWDTFTSTVFAHRPAESQYGLTNDQLANIAEDAGASQDVAKCIKNEVFGDYALASSEYASAELGVTGTPTVRIDGEEFRGWTTPGALKAAVLAKVAETGAAEGSSEKSDGEKSDDGAGDGDAAKSGEGAGDGDAAGDATE